MTALKDAQHVCLGFLITQKNLFTLEKKLKGFTFSGFPPRMVAFQLEKYCLANFLLDLLCIVNMMSIIL